jgi:hypothetical protein
MRRTVKIYSDKLTPGNLTAAARIVPGLGFENFRPLPRPRLARAGWDILLYRSGSHQGFAKGYGSHGHGAASWADYGWFLAGLYEADPDMKVRASANYDGAADFHRQTRYAFQGERQPGVTPLKVTPGRGRPAHLRDHPDFRPAAPVHDLPSARPAHPQG